MFNFGAGAWVLLLLEITHARRLLLGSSCDVYELRSDSRADATELLLLEETSDCDWSFFRRRCSERFSERDIDLVDSSSGV